MNARIRPDGWRATALAAALFAVTLNFLQPLVHAALMREGSPAALWSVLCRSVSDDRQSPTGSAPVSTVDHECCLGLAHAPALLAPSSAFALTPSGTPEPALLLPVARFGSAGIGDGLHHLRGPPSFLA